jgi:GT2 family glycosyltransferase
LPRIPLTTVVVVSYNVCNLLVRCLASVFASEGANLAEVLVVDNDSQDGSADAVRSSFPDARLIANPSNRGFGAANNLALAMASGDQVLLINPDAELEPGALDRLTRVLWSEPEIAVVGPRLRYADGTQQSSRRRFPTPLTALLESTLVQQCWPNNPVARRYYAADRSDDLQQDVDWLVGACWLVRRAAFESMGGFDERFFMYSEELDWCRRARAAGWRVVYCPGATVVHREGKSSEQHLGRRARNFQESKSRYFEKYYGFGAGIALRVVLLAFTLVELTRETIKLAVGHRPELRRSRTSALADLARDQADRLLDRCGARRQLDRGPCG